MAVAAFNFEALAFSSLLVELLLLSLDLSPPLAADFLPGAMTLLSSDWLLDEEDVMWGCARSGYTSVSASAIADLQLSRPCNQISFIFLAYFSFSSEFMYLMYMSIIFISKFRLAPGNCQPYSTP